ncbi:MAG: FAD-binding oxidoreductase [bacterium]
MDRTLLDQLRRIVGPGHVAAGRTDTEVYSYDGSLALGTPEAIVFPADADETAAVVGLAHRAGVPCIPRGFGTNLSGGSVAPEGGVVVCLTRLTRILSVEPERRLAVVQPGVTNLELQDALAPLGYTFAPDPASQKVATLGGNVGENSGGPHCVKHGVTTNHILGLAVVLPDGESVRLGGPALDRPGYDLRGLLVGCEGTLGVVTEVTCRIVPRAEAVVTMLAVYDSLRDAASSVSAIVAAGIVPATLEMMDAPVMRAVEERFPCGYPLDAAAVLIIEVEGPEAGLREQAARIQALCRDHGCRSIREAQSEAERDQLWAGRRGAFGALARIAPNFLVCDCTVPRTRLPVALDQVADLSAQHGFHCGNVFHAGDGNLHPVLFFDARDADQLRRVHEAGHAIMEACVALGGTITGEHGVGVEKIEGMRMVFDDATLSLQNAVYRAFDPTGRFNPGKILPPLQALKDEAEPPATALGHELRPDSAEGACAMVRATVAAGKALAPVGGGRRAGFGNASARDLIPLRSNGLAGVVEIDSPNQVATFGAGTPLAAAQEALAEHGQWLPLRPPLADGCTLGGTVALGAVGPERLLHGAPRDRLLGLRFVSGEGRLIAAGGRVVKNVAGYDLTRLLCGSGGTLGFLTELTFRVATRPEACRMVTASGTLEACAAAAAALLASPLEPAFVTALPAEPWRLRVGFEGFDVTVGAQVERATGLLAEAGLEVSGAADFRALAGPHAIDFEALWACPFVLRVDVPIGATAAFLAEAHHVVGGATMLADFGCGRLTAGLGKLPDEAWREVGAVATRAGGHALLERAPAAFKAAHDVFGPPRAAWPLMHRLKAALDPHAVFAPGRLPGRR